MRKTLVSLLLSSILYIPASAQSESPKDDGPIQLDKLPGPYSIAVSVDDTIKYDRHFNETKTEEVFDDQSLTKSMGSLLIGIAINMGSAGITSPIKDRR